MKAGTTVTDMDAIDSMMRAAGMLPASVGVVVVAAVVLAVALFVLVSLSRVSVSKNVHAGLAGERRVVAAIEAAGLSAVHDVYLRIGRGMTQIDHVVAVGRGLLVVETKNFSGVIYGRAQDLEWLQVRSDGRRRFRNPLLQNRTHIDAVRACIGGKVEGLVVFAGSAVFPKGIPQGVIVLDGLAENLRDRGAPSFFTCRRFARLQRRLSRTDRDKAKRAHMQTLRRARRA